MSRGKFIADRRKDPRADVFSTLHTRRNSHGKLCPVPYSDSSRDGTTVTLRGSVTTRRAARGSRTPNKTHSESNVLLNALQIVRRLLSFLRNTGNHRLQIFSTNFVVRGEPFQIIRRVSTLDTRAASPPFKILFTLFVGHL